MSLFRKRPSNTSQSAESRVGRTSIPQTSERGSALINGAIGQALDEFGPKYEARVGATVTGSTLLFIPYITMFQQLGFLVDWLLMDERADFALDDYSRREAIANIAPMWDQFFASNPAALAHIDCVFRVAAMALHNADESEERRAGNVWFEAASDQLAQIERLLSGSR